ncbi:hypothetical protein PPS11_02164 [Pseudomonas putida S11]|nr:hypothetical protein PPS11_02164 [Pseudomonas putida S11]
MNCKASGPRLKLSAGRAQSGRAASCWRRKASAPVDIDVRVWLGDPAHTDQLLLHQLLHLQARAVGRLVDQRGIQQAHLDLAQQRFAVAHLAADGMAGQLAVQGTDPVEQHRVAQAHLSAHVQHLLAALGQR